MEHRARARLIRFGVSFVVITYWLGAGLFSLLLWGWSSFIARRVLRFLVGAIGGSADPPSVLLVALDLTLNGVDGRPGATVRRLVSIPLTDAPEATVPAQPEPAT